METTGLDILDFFLLTSFIYGSRISSFGFNLFMQVVCLISAAAVIATRHFGA